MSFVPKIFHLLFSEEAEEERQLLEAVKQCSWATSNWTISKGGLPRSAKTAPIWFPSLHWCKVTERLAGMGWAFSLEDSSVVYPADRHPENIKVRLYFNYNKPLEKFTHSKFREKVDEVENLLLGIRDAQDKTEVGSLLLSRYSGIHLVLHALIENGKPRFAILLARSELCAPTVRFTNSIEEKDFQE